MSSPKSLSVVTSTLFSNAARSNRALSPGSGPRVRMSIVELLQALAPAVPEDMTVIVLCPGTGQSEIVDNGQELGLAMAKDPQD